MENVESKSVPSQFKNFKIDNNKITSELSDVDVQMEIVHEFFNGKYTIDEVKEYFEL